MVSFFLKMFNEVTIYTFFWTVPEEKEKGPKREKEREGEREGERWNSLWKAIAIVEKHT